MSVCHSAEDNFYKEAQELEQYQHYPIIQVNIVNGWIWKFGTIVT